MAQQRSLRGKLAQIAIPCTVLVVFFDPGLVFSQDLDLKPATGVEMSQQEQQAMQEILEIRKQLGGGLSLQLDGLLVPEPGSDFGSTLQDLIQNNAQEESREPPSSERWPEFPKPELVPRALSRPILLEVAKTQVSLCRQGGRVNLYTSVEGESAVTLLEDVEIDSIQPAKIEPRSSGTVPLSVTFLLTPQQVLTIERCSERSALTMVPCSKAQNWGVSEPDAAASFSKEKIQQLRLAARDIDRVASDLEDLEMYADADALRLRAQQLRSAARLKSDTTDIMRR
ncbi:MAG: hypothetical protein MK106_12120 [Mariniblastus sp.]|nr:hypothetical protein [Mariniblastus sp.]